MGAFATKLFLAVVVVVLFDVVLYAIAKFVENEKEIKEKIFKCYEYIRQRICKKGNKVDDDAGAIHDNAEFYDSSSVWED